jgi:hypothetical protein
MRSIVGSALCSTFFAAAALAQGVTTGAISGKVSDAQGQAVAEATIRVTHRGTGFITQTRTRTNGEYLVQGLEVGGPYTIVIRAIGFQPFNRDGIDVKLSEATRVDAQLIPQAVELSAVTVTGAITADFAPTRQGVGTQISDTLVQRIPTFSRDFIDQLKLAPQVVFPASGAASGAGAYNRYNTITIDGANQSERFNLGSSGGVPGGAAGGKIVSLEAVKEFRVMFTPSDVRQGNFAGMLVNAVSKSGTNDFHGGALYTYRSSQDVLGVDLVAARLRTPKFDVKQYGFHVGGPIIRDRLHFFLAPEWQQRAEPASGPYFLNGNPSPPPDDPGVTLDTLQRVIDVMQTNYGFNVGSTSPVDRETPLTNLFGRLDLQISPVHRFVVRQIINHNQQDQFFRSATNTYTGDPLTQNNGFRFTSNQFAFDSRNTSTTAQLYSNFPSGMSNELIVGYSTIKDARSVPVRAPEVTVGVQVGTARRAVTFGTEQFSPNNLLDQKIFELVNNFTMPIGQHTWTFGGRVDRTHIFNNFQQGSYGVYKFFNIDSLAAGRPNGYAVAYANSQNPADIPADFHVNVYSLYGQDQWAVNDRLTITAGLRADIPWLPDHPALNDTLRIKIDSAVCLKASCGDFSVNTSLTPKTRVLFSPRIGFNYNPGGASRNQIRGSVGVYTGPPPYILLGNAYANTGLGLVRLSCTTSKTVPNFTLDVNALPTGCRDSVTSVITPPGPGQAGTLGVNTTDPNFKYPQFFGISGGFDRELPAGVVLTVEAMYRKAINAVVVRDLNLIGPRMVGGQPYRDRDGRVLYADTIVPGAGTLAGNVAAGSATNNNQRWLTSLRGVGFTEGIIDVTNESKDYNYSISGQLHKRFSDRLEATVAYTYLKSMDVQSLTSDRAISNFRFGRQTATALTDYQLTNSNFSRPHRILAYGTYSLPWLTDITVYYEGSAGVPFVYVAGGAGDLNGDLVNGNDPIYIPRNATDPNEVQVGTLSGTAPNQTFNYSPTQAQALERFISDNHCLDRQRGRIMERNSCRSPFQHRFDLSVKQSLPAVRGQQLSLQLDIFNFLNLLNNDWGQIRLPTLAAFNNNQSALTVIGRTPGALSTSQPLFTFDSRLYQSDATKPNFGTPKAFESRTTGSSYQLQLTLRYSF